ncbi:MAG: PQQ-binding-like beta-propeller repeat protein [Phycisphaerae bacterium]|nr:PQQ-binding-like beta-propeller repeat protein [Phycisphaerae bacterium]
MTSLLKWGRQGFVLAVMVSMGWAWTPTATVGAAVADFAFLQISDIHVSPRPAGARNVAEPDLSAEGLAWFAEQAVRPQVLTAQGITTPPPAFVLATGDICEYGAIAGTWDVVERYFAAVKLPIYLTAGNHDYTWAGIMPIIAKAYGYDHYSFDEFGCHFVCIETATPQEPLPCIDQRTVAWLAKDLKPVSAHMPVIVFCHHPPSTTEFPQPQDPVRLQEALSGHNVVLLLMGHGHGVRHEKLGPIDCVMGGSTYGPNTGYGIVAVTDGVLRVAYRFKDAAKPMQTLVEKSLAAPRLPSVEIVDPGPQTLITGPAIDICARAPVGGELRLTAALNNNHTQAVPLVPAESVFRARLAVGDLLPGAHVVHLQVTAGALKLDRLASFVYAPSDSPVGECRIQLDSGSKARPLAVGDEVIVAGTDGRIVAVRAGDPAGGPRIVFDGKSSILHEPALADGVLYFGASDRMVHAVSLAGKHLWKTPVKGCALGTPVVEGGVVYVGDLEGGVTAIDRQGGEVRWSKPLAVFSIEMPLRLHGGVLYFGAWDGHVYAVDAATGVLKWKAIGPAGQNHPKQKNRYYSPADCPGIVVGDRVFFTDRAYQLGSYLLDGKYLGDIAEDVAAIGPTEDGKGFYARGLAKGLTRYDGAGKQVWTESVPMGRFPCPPTEVGGVVYACSNVGVLRAHDGATGRLLWEYQATPGTYVMAPVAVDDQGRAIVIGMDGTLVRVAPVKPR